MNFLAAIATASALHLRSSAHSHQAEKLTTALIYSVKKGTCLTDDGEDVFLSECNYDSGSDERIAQKWHFMSRPDDTVFLRSGTGSDDKCLVSDDGRRNNAHVTLGSCDDALMFEWNGSDMLTF